MKFLPFLLVVVLFSCHHDFTKDDIVGKWKVTAFDSEDTIFNNVMMRIIRDIAFSEEYIFEKNGEFYKTIQGKTDSKPGKWTYSEESKELILTYPENGIQQIWTHQNRWSFEHITQKNNYGSQKIVIKKQ